MMNPAIQQLAWFVLETMNRTQGKGTTVRLVAPRAPEVLRELDPTLSEHELLAAEWYLHERGYIVPANLELTWGTYTIAPAGLEWLDGGLSGPPGATRVASEEGQRSEARPDSQEHSERLELEWRRLPWWRRVFGG